MFDNSFVHRLQAKLLLEFCPIIPDRLYLKWTFKNRMGYPLNLDNPQSFSEKLQWLKLNDIHPEYTPMVDKAEAKKIVVSIIGDKYVIPTLGLWNNVEDIDWENLPNSFVVKSTNDSGGVVVCKDKSNFDKSEAEKKLKLLGGREYTKYNKEYPYRDVPHRFIAEKYMEDESGELRDYKIFCFNGKARFLFVATGRQLGDTRFDFFDEDFNHLPVLNGHPNADVLPQRPENFEKMLEIAEALSQGIPHVRVDLYNVKGNIYFGEYTFFHWSGMVPFEPIEWDYKFGEYLILPSGY